MRYLLTAIVVLAGQSAQAETQCHFSKECMDGETCTETTFALSYWVSSCPRAPGPRFIGGSTDFGGFQGREIGSSCTGDTSKTRQFLMVGDGTTYLLTRHDRQALLSVHMDGPTAITYRGTCEAQE